MSLQVCTRAKTKKNMWYLDSGCFHQITRDKAMFSSISPKYGGYVTFGDNAKANIVGEGKVGKSFNSTIDDVQVVNGLKHNLLNISQFCDKNCKVVFNLPNVLLLMKMIMLYLLVLDIIIFILLICLILKPSMKNVLLV